MFPVKRNSIYAVQNPLANKPRHVPDAEPPFVVIARAYPRISRAIELMWGNRELDDYLHQLIVSNRETRTGFPEDVLAALHELYDQHLAQFKFAKHQDAPAQWAATFQTAKGPERH